MSTKMFNRLQDERDGIVVVLDKIVQAHEEDGEDLTEPELATRSDGIARIAEIDLQIVSLASDLSQSTEIARKMRLIGSPDEDGAYRSAGEALWDLLHQNEPESQRRYRLAMRAAEHMGTLAAHTTATAGDLGGLVIAPNVGAVIDPYPKSMPFLTALGVNRIPAGTFGRPYVFDPDFEASVGKQTLEKAELPSKKFEVKSDPLSAETYGTYINVSQQLISLESWSLNFIIRHLRKRLAWKLEAVAIAELALTTGTQALSADADAAATQKAVYAAAAAIMGTTKEMGELLVMGPLGFAQFGGLADLAGRPMFPYLGASNAPGTSTANAFTSNVYGFPAVITSAIKDTTVYMINSESFEAWYMGLPMLQAVEPSVLGRQVAVSAMLTPNRPEPNSNAAIAIKPAHT